MREWMTQEEKEKFQKALTEAAEEAVQEGAQMAAEDAASGQMPVADAPAAAEPTPEVNADAQLLQSLGFGSLDELANAYKETLRTGSEMREMLTQLAALQQAMDNEDDLDPNNPEDQVRLIVRREHEDILKKYRDNSRNLLIQEKWRQSEAAKAEDIEEQMPDIWAEMMNNPKLSLDEEGLQRAYDAARSKKYRSEASLMGDAEFLKRVAANPDVKKAVLEEYLQGVARTGDAIPQGITGGGNTPLTGRETITSMETAKNKLAQMLGMR